MCVRAYICTSIEQCLQKARKLIPAWSAHAAVEGMLNGISTGEQIRHMQVYVFFSSRRRHTRLQGDWSSDVCSSDLYWSASREPQRSMTSRGYDPRQSPGLEYKRVVSCKASFHGTDVLAVSEHGAPGRRPNIHTHFVGRQREDGLDTPPARAAEANRSTVIADIPFPALETSQSSGARAKNERSESVQRS